MKCLIGAWFNKMSGLAELHKYIIKLEERIEKLEGLAFGQSDKNSLDEFKGLNWPLILTALNALGKANIRNRRANEVFDYEFNKLLSFLDGHDLNISGRIIDNNYLKYPEAWALMTDNTNIKYNRTYSERMD